MRDYSQGGLSAVRVAILKAGGNPYRDREGRFASGPGGGGNDDKWAKLDDKKTSAKAALLKKWETKAKIANNKARKYRTAVKRAESARQGLRQATARRHQGEDEVGRARVRREGWRRKTHAADGVVMTNVRPAADPDIFGAALPKTDKPYTGNPSVVDSLVARVAIAALKFAQDGRAGRPPEDTMPALTSEVDAVRDVFLGKNDGYELMPWHRDGSILKYLDERYAMDGADDPIGGLLVRMALGIVRLYRNHEMGHIGDTEAEVGVAALKAEMARDLLGLPLDRMDGL